VRPRAPANEWQFSDANHALLTGRAESRLMLCPECAAAIKGALHAVAYRAKRKTSGNL
jgi:hypothetical protein